MLTFAVRRANMSRVVPNHAVYRVPCAVHAGKGRGEFTASSLDYCRHVPCATLLVRVTPAPKSPDGLTTLSIDSTPGGLGVGAQYGVRVPARMPACLPGDEKDQAVRCSLSAARCSLPAPAGAVLVWLKYRPRTVLFDWECVCVDLR